ncbi:unnamed protein product [Prorocentrum cordatum]|uniref:Nickel/cobalt efflux system n=1 Tax=Prorocentrum cordatum TaxID=2364126 RepID=A0ABN9VM61_9DINO|nr:unnamed protein product [Polarella glacialis]
MCLVDTGNGLLMLATYNWAKVRPSEKIFYNFLVTSMSATIALCIGTLELLQVICRAVGLHGPFWESVSSIDMAAIGYGIIVAFLVIFAAAVCFSCTRREERLATARARERARQPRFLRGGSKLTVQGLASSHVGGALAGAGWSGSALTRPPPGRAFSLIPRNMSASSATSCATFQGALVFSVGQDIPAAP